MRKRSRDDLYGGGNLMRIYSRSHLESERHVICRRLQRKQKRSCSTCQGVETFLKIERRLTHVSCVHVCCTCFTHRFGLLLPLAEQKTTYKPVIRFSLWNMSPRFSGNLYSQSQMEKFAASKFSQKCGTALVLMSSLE